MHLKLGLSRALRAAGLPTSRQCSSLDSTAVWLRGLRFDTAARQQEA